jgi:hypothetical protein
MSRPPRSVGDLRDELVAAAGKRRRDELAAEAAKRRRSEVEPPSGEEPCPAPSSEQLPPLPVDLQLDIVRRIEAGSDPPLLELARIWYQAYSLWSADRFKTLAFPPSVLKLMLAGIAFVPSRATLMLARLAFAPEWTLLTSLPAEEAAERLRLATAESSVFLRRRLPRGAWAPAIVDRNLVETAVDSSGGLQRRPLETASEAELLFYARGTLAWTPNAVGTTLLALSRLSNALFWNAWPPPGVGSLRAKPRAPSPEMLAWRDKALIVRATIFGPERASFVLLARDASGSVGVSRAVSAVATAERALEEIAAAIRFEASTVTVEFGFGRETVLRRGGEVVADPKATLWSLWLATLRGGVEPAIADLKEQPAWGYDLDTNLTWEIAGRTRQGLLIMPAPVFFYLEDGLAVRGGGRSAFWSRVGEVQLEEGAMLVALPGTDPKMYAPHDIVWLDDAAGPEEMARLTLLPKPGARVLEL